MRTKTSRAFLALLLVGTLSGHLSADVVETKNGARIIGKVISIDTGSVLVDTDYAGRSVKGQLTYAQKRAHAVAIRGADGWTLRRRGEQDRGAARLEELL